MAQRDETKREGQRDRPQGGPQGGPQASPQGAQRDRTALPAIGRPGHTFAHAGMAVRRMPPPDGPDAGAWRIMPEAASPVANQDGSYGGTAHQPPSQPPRRPALGARPRQVAAAPETAKRDAAYGDTMHQDARPDAGPARDDSQTADSFPDDGAQIAGPHGERADPPAGADRGQAARAAPGGALKPPPPRRSPVFMPPAKAAPLAGPPAGRSRAPVVPENVIEDMPDPADGGSAPAVLDGERALRAPDTAPDAGPDRNEMQMLAQARIRSSDKRRAKVGKPRRAAPGGSNYVLKSSTQAAYVSRGKSLMARYQREQGVHLADEDVDPADFVNWLFTLKPGLSGSTWRLYRIAALTRIQTVPHERLDEAAAIIEADIGAGGDEARAQQHGRRVGQVRSERAKRFDKADFDEILRKMRTLSRSEALPWLRDWMIATIHTGLRPSEWSMTTLTEQRDPNRLRGRMVKLYVGNAKATFGRAGSPCRTLDISDFTDETTDAVRQMVVRCGQWSKAGQFEKRQSQCMQILYEVCSALYPRQVQRYSLYSLRHQFIANMKTIYGPAEIAALVGHVTDETSVEHYGKRRTAWQQHHIRDTPVPLAADVAQVRRRLETYNERKAAKLARLALLAERKANKADKAAMTAEQAPKTQTPGAAAPVVPGTDKSTG